MCPKLGRIGNKKGEVRALGRTSPVVIQNKEFGQIN